MRPQAIILSLCCLLAAVMLPAQQDPAQLSYLNSYKDLAIREMVRTGIPASITLAQAILESAAGQSELARMANNQFGIKCGAGWTGFIFMKKDDDFGPDGRLTFSCFRVYASVEESFRDHSDFLTDPRKTDRYGFLFALDNTDYKGWARGLQQAGYATNETYPERLIGIIERYGLQQYDLVFPARETPLASYPPLVTTTNDVANTFATGYETAGDIAYRTGVPLGKILEYNEGLVDGYVLPRGEKVYLEAKRKKFRGPLQYHEVEPSESVYYIAQRYGIRIDKLLARNRLEEGQEPEPGEVLKLSGRKVADPPASHFVRPGVGPDREEQPSAISQPVIYHLVKKNDTLWNIALRYNTSVEELKRLNNLSDSLIRRGMSLRVQ